MMSFETTSRIIRAGGVAAFRRRHYYSSSSHWSATSSSSSWWGWWGTKDDKPEDNNPNKNIINAGISTNNYNNNIPASSSSPASVNLQEEDCPFCRKFSMGPCGHVFSAWHAQCVKATPTTSAQLSACRDMAEEMIDCWKRHDVYYQPNPWNITESLSQGENHDNEDDEEEIASSSQELHQEWVGIVQEIQKIYPNPIIFEPQHQQPPFQLRLIRNDAPLDSKHSINNNSQSINQTAQILLPLQDLDIHGTESSSRRSLVVAFSLVQPNQEEGEDTTTTTTITKLLTSFASSLSPSSQSEATTPPLLLAAGSVDDLLSEWDHDEFPSRSFGILPVALPSATDDSDETTVTDSNASKLISIAVYALYEADDDDDNDNRNEEVSNNTTDNNSSCRFYATTMTIPCR